MDNYERKYGKYDGIILRDYKCHPHCTDLDAETGLLLHAVNIHFKASFNKDCNLIAFYYHGKLHNPDLDLITGEPLPAKVLIVGGEKYEQYFIMGKEYPFYNSSIDDPQIRKNRAEAIILKGAQYRMPTKSAYKWI